MGEEGRTAEYLSSRRQVITGEEGALARDAGEKVLASVSNKRW